MTSTDSIVFAGFWKRFFAYGYDSLIVTLLGVVVSLQLGGSAFAQTPAEVDAQIQTLVQAGLLPEGTAAYNLIDMVHYQLAQLFSWANIAPLVILSAIYNIGFVCGPWQATPGKRYCNIHVINADGSKLTLVQSILRHVATGPSILLSGLPYATIFFSREKCAPHDMLCKTRVVLGKVD